MDMGAGPKGSKLYFYPIYSDYNLKNELLHHPPTFMGNLSPYVLIITKGICDDWSI